MKKLEEIKTMIRNIDGDIFINSLEIKDVIDIKLLQRFQDNFAESMGARTDKQVNIPSSRNPDGSYSDVAVGHQHGPYKL